MTTYTYTSHGIRYRIKVQPIGQAFGCAGYVYDARGRKRLAETDTVPHGMEHVAAQRAESLADRLAQRG